MNRWLVWGCVAVVAAGALYGIASKAGSSPANGASTGPSSETARKATPAPPAVPIHQRMLTDDTLAPPAADAPESDWRIYQQILESIQKGDDPINHAPRPRPDRSTADEEHQRRIEERKAESAKRLEQSKEHAKISQDRAKAHQEEMRKRREEHRAQADPSLKDHPPSQPLVPIPPLGPPTSGTEKDPK